MFMRYKPIINEEQSFYIRLRTRLKHFRPRFFFFFLCTYLREFVHISSIRMVITQSDDPSSSHVEGISNQAHASRDILQQQENSASHQHDARITEPNRFHVSSRRQHNAEDIEVDGRVYDKRRDPPGQKSVYIPPGEPEKESYRLSTFIKFPEFAPVNPCTLATHGFLYTGYKDRVKCFSCGNFVQDWAFGDNERQARWHLSGCELVIGIDRLNQPIGNRQMKFEGDFTSSCKSVDSGISSMGSTSSNVSANLSFERNVKVQSPLSATTVSDQHEVQLPRSSSGEMLNVTQNMSSMQIGNNNVMNVTNVIAQSSPLQQTARYVEPTPKKPTPQEFVMANVTSSSHKEFLIRNLDLTKEEDRRKSFESWNPFTYTVGSRELAKSGFFYLGNLDRVQCFSCAGVLRNWKSGDDVDEQHRLHYPHCRMILKTETRNVALPEGHDNSTTPKQTGLPEPPDPDPAEMQRLSELFPCSYPVNPHMRSLEARLETFSQKWPSHRVMATTQHIAKAGFYYLGERDRAKCWYCNGGLQNWDPNDEPWTEHAKWFPGCEYVLRSKGIPFVKNILSQFPRLPRPALRNARLDHRSGELFQSAPNLGQRPPPVEDPRKFRSAGALVQNYSPSTSSRIPVLADQIDRIPDEEANLSSIERDVKSMGFPVEKIKRAVKKYKSETGKTYSDVTELVDAVLAIKDDVTSEQSTMEVGSNLTQPPSLKRNSNSTGNDVINDVEMTDQQVPRKVSKKGKQDLSEELQALESERKCKICEINVADTVLFPCGHLVSCHSCAKDAKRCAICREKVQNVIRVFLA